MNKKELKLLLKLAAVQLQKNRETMRNQIQNGGVYVDRTALGKGILGTDAVLRALGGRA